jgi:hypothetical protein
MVMFSRQARRRFKQTQEFVWPAPVAGLVRSGPRIKAKPNACEVLENFICTAEGARLRGGATLWATAGDALESLFTFNSGSTEKFYAATENAVYDVTTVADPAVEEVPEISGLGSGDWSTVQFATPGGQFVIAVNGVDNGMYYNGTTWNALWPDNQNQITYGTLLGTPFVAGDILTSGSRTAEILMVLPATATTGTLILGAISSGHFSASDTLTTAAGVFVTVATATSNSTDRSTAQFDAVNSDDLSFVWAHKRRLWFVEKDTLSAWYLPVNSIAGTAVEFPLDGVFSLGGALLFGGTWSQDSGDGLDDLAVFVTTEGQIAVYQGTDPSDAATWALVGVYRIGKPLGKNSWFRAGGDLVILTEDGIVPVSEALRKDRAALQAEAITSPIEDLWQEAIAQRSTSFRFSVALWSTRTALFIGIPTLQGGTAMLAANTRSAAWSTLTGWPARCIAVFQDRLFYGDADGRIVLADTGGSDMGAPYAGRYVPKFQEMNTSLDKIGLHAQLIYRSAEDAKPRLVAFSNYQIGDFPAAQNSTGGSGNVWGTGVWGTSVWGAGSAPITRTDWQAVAGGGFSISVGLIVGSNTADKPTFEIVGTVLRYEVGRSI